MKRNETKMSIGTFNKEHFRILRIKHHCDEFFNTVSGNSFRKYSEQFNKPVTSYLVQSQLWKYQNNVWNLAKVNKKDTRTKMKQERCLWKDFTHCPSISIFDFEQVNVCWVLAFFWFGAYSNSTKTLWGEGINNHF